MDEDKIVFAQETAQRTLAEVIVGADIFLGLSAAGVLKPEMVATMAPRPIIFALANPTPEILPEEVHAVRNDAIVATGRTDYPNQINNVLCFPYIFRGALDSGATTITVEMEIAAVHAIAELAQAESSEVVTRRLRRRDAQLRPRVPDPEAVRSAPDDADRAGGRQGRRRVGRRGAADRRHGRLPRRSCRPSSTRRARRCGRSSTSPRRRRRSASPTPRARKSVSCARSRSSSTRTWRGRR